MVSQTTTGGLVPATMRSQQGSNISTPTGPAGNQFYNDCIGSTDNHLFADNYVTEEVVYFNNKHGSIFDPAPCIATNYNDVSASPLTPPTVSTACPTPPPYNNGGSGSTGGQLTNVNLILDTMSTSNPEYPDLVTQQSLLMSWMARYYAMNGKNDSAAAMFSNANRYAEALPFYVAAQNFTKAYEMWDSLATDDTDEMNFKYLTKLSLDIYSTGHTWFDLDSTNRDSVKNMVQLNHKPGYMAGSVSQLLGIGKVQWPIPVIDTTFGHGHGSYRTAATDSTNTLGGIYSNSKFMLYPNPTISNFTIATPISGIFYLYSLDGSELAQYIVSGDANTFSLPKGLTAGVYMGKFKGSDGSSDVVRMVYMP